MKIGILCASDTELSPFLPHIEHRRVTESAMLTVREGKIGDMEVCALYSGVGKVNAAAAAQLLIDRYGVRGMICSGTAGGVDPSVGLFDTVVSVQTAYHDVSDDILTEFHPWMSSVWFDADPLLLTAARRTARNKRRVASVRFGRMVTGESFVDDAPREKIWRKMAPLSVDMESAAIHHVCYVNRIPFLAVRVITDDAAHSGHEHFDENCGRASEMAANFVLALLAELGRER